MASVSAVAGMTSIRFARPSSSTACESDGECHQCGSIVKVRFPASKVGLIDGGAGETYIQ